MYCAPSWPSRARSGAAWSSVWLPRRPCSASSKIVPRRRRTPSGCRGSLPGTAPCSVSTEAPQSCAAQQKINAWGISTQILRVAPGSPAVSLGPRLLASLLVRFPVLRDLCCSTQVMMSVVQATAALGRKPADAPFDTCMKADPLECRTRRTRRHLLMKTPCC